jgi:uncharacterized protein (TIGR02996 family)
VAANEDLEAQIDASPDDPAAFLVYGDWLEAHGDPRGELVAVQAAQLSARGAELARLKARESELLATHADQLVGPELATYTKLGETIDWYCGFIQAADGGFTKSSLDHASTRFLRHSRCLMPRARAPLTAWSIWGTQGTIDWVGGCETLAALAVDGQLDAVPQAICEQLDALHVDALSVQGRLDRLCVHALPRLETLGFENVSSEVVPRVVDAVHVQSPRRLRLELSAIGAAMPAFGTVEAIASSVTSLGLEWFERAEQLGPLRRMTFGSLRELTMTCSGSQPDGSVFQHLPELPAVRRLVLGGTAMDKSESVQHVAASTLGKAITELDVRPQDIWDMRALFSAPFPALERLVLRAFWFTSKQLLWESVFARDDLLPALRALEVDGNRHIAHIAASPLASQLEELALRVDDDTGARAFLDVRHRFPRLKTLVVGGSRALSRTMLHELYTIDVDVRWKRLRAAVG